MKIYISHAKDFDYKNELYIPLRESNINNTNEIILPHEKSNEQFNSIDFMKKSCDLMIAEVSHRSTGLGIELGRAELLKVPVICIHKKGNKVAGSVKSMQFVFIEYDDSDDLLKKLEKKLSNLNFLQ